MLHQTVVDLTGSPPRLQQWQGVAAEELSYDPPVDARGDAAGLLPQAYRRLAVDPALEALAAPRLESRLRPDINRLLAGFNRELSQVRAVLCLPYTAPSCLARAVLDSLNTMRVNARLVRSPVAACFSGVATARLPIPAVVAVVSGYPPLAEAVLVELCGRHEHPEAGLLVKVRACTRLPTTEEAVDRVMRMIARAGIAPRLVLAVHDGQRSVAEMVRERCGIAEPVVFNPDDVLRGAAIWGLEGGGEGLRCGPFTEASVQHVMPAGIGLIGTVRTAEPAARWAWRRLIAAGEPPPWRTSLRVGLGAERPKTVLLAMADDDSAVWLDVKNDSAQLLLDAALELPPFPMESESPQVELEFRLDERELREAVARWSDASVDANGREDS